MIWYKTCSRCGGDLVQGSDLHGDYISCMQCGGILSDLEQCALTGITESPSYYSQLLATKTPGRQRQRSRLVRRAA